MSLINEALKKAQPERPSDKSNKAHITAPPLPHQKPPKRKKNYLWGFLMAIIIVGLFSAAVSSFLVYQILGEEEGTQTTSTESQPEEASPESDQAWEKMAVNEKAKPLASEADGSTAGSIPEPSESGQASTATQEPDAGAVAPARLSAAEILANAPPSRPNPAVWARLQELEIRGIMSDGNKVLIFDTSTGKTKSYKPGEILDGSLALKVASIDSTIILFEDYDGSIHTKSF
jgi:cytoskeletal protein RodZ